jgi:hypothetical protein
VSPAQPHGLIWGAGPVFQLPTDTDDLLGNKNWGLGRLAVVLRLEKGDPWVYGVLANNVWSLSSRQAAAGLQQLPHAALPELQLPRRLYLTSAPIVTVNWKAESNQQWTVPLGGGIGKIFHFGKLPVNTQLGAYYNVVHPDDGANWQLRLQLQFMFPK